MAGVADVVYGLSSVAALEPAGSGGVFPLLCVQERCSPIDAGSLYVAARLGQTADDSEVAVPGCVHYGGRPEVVLVIRRWPSLPGSGPNERLHVHTAIQTVEARLAWVGC